MNEVKKLLAQVKMFVDSPVDELSDPLLESLIGYEFSTQLELEKSREFQKFLRKNAVLQPELREINEVVYASLRVFEKEIVTQRLRDLNSALRDLMRSASAESKDFGRMLDEVRVLVENPSDFKKSTLNLEQEVYRLEEELSELISLPYMHEQSDFPLLSDGLSIDCLAEPRPAGALRVLPAAAQAAPEVHAEFQEEPSEAMSPVRSVVGSAGKIPRWARPPQTTIQPTSEERVTEFTDVDVSCLVLVKPSEPPAETTQSKKFSEIEALAARYRSQC